MELIHIINPADHSLGADPANLRAVQPIVYKSIQSAKRYAEFSRRDLNVSICAAYYPEDEIAVPGFAQKCVPLQRSSQSLGIFRAPRKLPILKDILESAPTIGQGAYYIYTNSDIIISPLFYDSVLSIIDAGHDSITITRRTLPQRLKTSGDMNEICTTLGDDHPGHDCFVFSKKLKDRIELGETCVGAEHLVPPFLSQLICFADNFIRITDRHLTFHIGDERTWKDDAFADYAQFNFDEAKKVINRLNDDGLLVEHLLIRSWLKRFGVPTT